MLTNLLLTLILVHEPATVRLLVEPPEGVVWIGGQRVETEGAQRLLVTPPLPFGQRFVYRVTARWGDVERAWTLRVQAGQACALKLSRDEGAPRLEGDGDGVRNFGIDCSKLAPPAQLASVEPRDEIRLNDTPITHAQAARLLRGETLPDDAGKPRLTIIGPEPARRQVLADLRGPLADLAGSFLVQDYHADHWAVARAGFHTAGNPTIYVQEATGKVLHRQDDYADGPTGLRRALQAVRKPNPKYDPANDADLRRPARRVPWDAVIVAGAIVLLLVRFRRVDS